MTSDVSKHSDVVWLIQNAEVRNDLYSDDTRVTGFTILTRSEVNYHVITRVRCKHCIARVYCIYTVQYYTAGDVIYTTCIQVIVNTVK